MAAILWADVTGEASELAGVGPVAQTVILSVVNGAGLNTANFGGEDADLTRAARILLAAHMATMNERKGTGALSSQSEGGASQSYWMGFANPRALHLTGYGQMLVQIIMGTGARAGLLVTSSGC